MFQFLQPYFLLLIIPIIGLVVFLYFHNKNIKHFVAYDELKDVYKTSTLYYYLYYIIIFLILLVSVLIIAQPVIKNTDEKVKKNGIDIMLVLDVSYSMIAEDLSPNRLEAAKNIIADFLNKQLNDRVGFVVFSGKPFTSLPLNFDYDISKKILNNISVETINQRVNGLQGTAIGDALIFAGDNFDDDSREKVMILLTDGEANVGVDPDISIQFLQEKFPNKNIRIYTIGIGKQGVTYINVPDSFGFTRQMEIAGVDEITLKNIAEKTGGKYYRASDNSSLNNIFDEINELEKTEIEIDTQINIESQIKPFTYLLSILLLLLISLKIRKNIYNR